MIEVGRKQIRAQAGNVGVEDLRTGPLGHEIEGLRL